VRTVEVHRARMMERLGGRQLAEVIRLGVIARLNASLPAKAGRAGRATIEFSPERSSRALRLRIFNVRLPARVIDAPMLQVGNGTADCLDRDREIIGDVIARDR
jgi:hypothetical protein